VKYEIAQLRHLYAQMLTWGGNIPNAARGLLGPTIEALERTEQSRDAIRAENETLRRLLRETRMVDRVKNVFDVCFRADIDAALAGKEDPKRTARDVLRSGQIAEPSPTAEECEENRRASIVCPSNCRQSRHNSGYQ
jgi:hypothetical protein